MNLAEIKAAAEATINRGVANSQYPSRQLAKDALWLVERVETLETIVREVLPWCPTRIQREVRAALACLEGA